MTDSCEGFDKYVVCHIIILFFSDTYFFFFYFCFFFQAEDGIRDLVRSRGLGDVYKRQVLYLLKVVEKIVL